MKRLQDIRSPAELKQISADEIPALCSEIREFLIEHISKTGGHFASNLGAVELAVAIDRVYDPQTDRIIYDVGHQAYVHKILTGRRESFWSLRQFGGLSGFPKPSESVCDAFITGHASTSVSAALGMARARTLLGETYDVCAVIGDGSMTGGLAYEAIADAGQSGEPLVVILNDNAMSISQSVGGMAQMLSHMRTKPAYFNFKRIYRKTVGRIGPLYRGIHSIKEWIKSRALPGNIFDDMGFYYLGPINGHDEHTLEQAIQYAKELRIPVLLHVITVKGKGYEYAERWPDRYHGVSGFDPLTGIVPGEKLDFSAVAGKTLQKLAEKDTTVTAITAAMLDGTGLKSFSEQFPNRFFDVGICEGHAVTMAAGMAKQGLKPVFCVYSSFLQRSFDMLIHDVALESAHVVFAVDRAGLVGADGETHHGVFDVNYLCTVPGMKVLCPASFAELQRMLMMAVEDLEGPVAVRYPRGEEGNYQGFSLAPVVVHSQGDDLTVICYGAMINCVLEAEELLKKQGISCDVIRLTRLDVPDMDMILNSVQKTKRLLVPEEAASAGCMGNRILAACAERGVVPITAKCQNLGSGIVPQGKVDELRALYALDGAGIAYTALSMLDRL